MGEALKRGCQIEVQADSFSGFSVVTEVRGRCYLFIYFQAGWCVRRAIVGIWRWFFVFLLLCSVFIKGAAADLSLG